MQHAVRGTCIYLASVAIRHQYRRKVKSIAIVEGLCKNTKKQASSIFSVGHNPQSMSMDCAKLTCWAACFDHNYTYIRSAFHHQYRWIVQNDLMTPQHV